MTSKVRLKVSFLRSAIASFGGQRSRISWNETHETAWIVSGMLLSTNPRKTLAFSDQVKVVRGHEAKKSKFKFRVLVVRYMLRFPDFRKEHEMTLKRFLNNPNRRKIKMGNAEYLAWEDFLTFMMAELSRLFKISTWNLLHTVIVKPSSTYIYSGFWKFKIVFE